ncbi:hypothetical protein DLAC_05380 [Tieghemostelium lacteum]|uniref:Uncharacterized protein n=1 Tax=Tieghemostelium lacteum TaxID=361077 RepID=A0A151ZFQ4_TIELA|nr:hypothetical protein DLAC_05380 [Tieghemostelium lacteum]|eukprot:KYQ92798.1 hypothetical protein DLAC_05380 [Tieghemostelium lacteum]
MLPNIYKYLLVLVVVLVGQVQSTIILSDEYLYANYFKVEYGDKIKRYSSKILNTEVVWNSLTMSSNREGFFFDPSKYETLTFYVKSPVANPYLEIQFTKNQQITGRRIALVSKADPGHSAAKLKELVPNEWHKVTMDIPNDSQYNSIHFMGVGKESESIPVNIDRFSLSEKLEKFELSQRVYRIKAAFADPELGGDNGGHSFYTAEKGQWIFGSYNSWYSAGDSGRFEMLRNGDVVVSGGIVPSNDPSSCHTWYIHILFTPVAPPSHVKEELSPDAYVPNGPIDPNSWRFYKPVQPYAYMIGTGCNHVDKIEFTGIKHDMPAYLGYGANGKNGNFGMSVWMTYKDSLGVSHGDSVIDMNIDILSE